MSSDGRGAVRTLAVAMFVSGVGSNMAGIALPIEVFDVTGGSAVWLSFTFLMTFGLQGLLSPVAGAIVDRFDRRRVAVSFSIAAASLWLVILLGDGPLWLALIGFVAVVVSMPIGTALMSAVPNLVSSEELSWANGTLAVARKTAQVPGFVLGGFVAATLGPGTAFVLNAVTFLVAALLIALVSGRFQADPGTERDESARRGSAFVGFGLIWRDPVLRPLFVIWTVLFLTIDMAVVADLPLAIELGSGRFGFGLLNAAWGIGAALGAWFGRKITRAFEPWAVLIGAVGAAAGYFMTALAPWLALAMLGQAIAAGTDAGDEVAGSSIIQRATSDAYRGRVFSAIFTAGLLANAVGFSFTGFLVQALGPRPVYAIAAAGSLVVVPLVFPMIRAIRERERTEPLEGSESE